MFILNKIRAVLYLFFCIYYVVCSASQASEIKENLPCNKITANNVNSESDTMSIEEIIKNTPPHPYEPRRIIYTDEFDKSKHILKLNVLQFQKYNFNKVTKPISESDYSNYKAQKREIKQKQLNNCDNKPINNVPVRFYTKFYIDKNKDFDYYIGLLYYLLKGSDKFNDDINKRVYDDPEVFKSCNYATQYDIAFTFDVFIENICNTMKNSYQIKYFKLDDEINEFKIGLQKNIDNNEKRDVIWEEFVIRIS